MIHFQRARKTCQESGKRIVIHRDILGVFHGIDKKHGRLLVHKRDLLGDPPILYCKLQNMLFPFLIDHITAQATLRDKAGVLTNFTNLKKDLSFLNSFYLT